MVGVLQKTKSTITKLKMKSGLNIFAIIFSPFLFLPSVGDILQPCVLKKIEP
jgi:hypothetical protein